MFPSAPNASLGKEMLNFMLRSSKPPQNKNFKVILEDEEGCDNERDDNDVDMNDIRSSGLKAGSEVDGGLRFLNEYMISRNNSNFDELRIPKENNEKVNIVIKDEIIEIDDDEEDDEDDDVITEEEERMIFARQGNLYQMRNIGGIQGSQGALNLSRKQSDTNDDWTNNYDKLRRASVMIKASPAAIDNKIEMALDLLKSHLLYAVKEEVGNLKREVKMIKKGNDRLERENEFMRRANRERLTQNKKNLDDTDINKKPIKIVEFKDETDKNRRSNSIENENEEPVTKMIVKDTKSHPTVAEKQIDSSTQTFPTEDPLQVPGFRSATAHGNQLNKQEGIQSFQEMELKPNRKSTRFLQQLSEPSHTLNMKRSGQTSLPQNNSVENFLSFMPPYDDNTFNNCNLNSENILLTNNSYDSNSYSLLSQYNSQPSSLTSKLLTDLNRQSEMTNFQKGIQKQLRLYQLQQQSSLYPTINLQDPQTEFSDNIFEQQILLERLKLQTLKTNQTCIQQLQQLSRLNRQPLDSDHLSSFFQPQSLPSSLSSSPPQFFNFNPPMVIKPPKNQRLTDIKEGSTLGSELNRLPRISSDPNFNRQ